MSPWFGRLNWGVTPFSDAIANPNTNNLVAAGAAALVVVGALFTLYFLTRRHLWGRLWHDWLTTADHKKIGIMYIMVALVMLMRGFIDAAMMRSQQAIAYNN